MGAMGLAHTQPGARLLAAPYLYCHVFGPDHSGISVVWFGATQLIHCLIVVCVVP